MCKWAENIPRTYGFVLGSADIRFQTLPGEFRRFRADAGIILVSICGTIS